MFSIHDDEMKWNPEILVGQIDPSTGFLNFWLGENI